MIYPDKKIPENNRGLRNGLANEILHEKMVDEQYKEGVWEMMNCLAIGLALSMHIGLQGDYNQAHPYATCETDKTIVVYIIIV